MPRRRRLQLTAAAAGLTLSLGIPGVSYGQAASTGAIASPPASQVAAAEAQGPVVRNGASGAVVMPGAIPSAAAQPAQPAIAALPQQQTLAPGAAYAQPGQFQAAVPQAPSPWTAPLAPFPGMIAPGQTPIGPTPIPPQGVQDPAFAAALTGALPMTPEMILELRRQLDLQQRAAARAPTPSGTNPRPSVRSLNLSLSPGGASPIIHTAPRHVTAVVFTDATGQPWPIQAVVNGNPQAFALDAPVRGGAMLAISALAAYGQGNLVVQLEGAATPVVLLLDGGSDRVDMRLDIRVQGRGPNARQEIIARGPAAPETGGASIMAMLDGVPPADARPMAVAGVSPDEARAWRVGGEIYLRTRHSVLSPAWSNSVSAADGTTVYALPNTPVVLVSVAGRPISLRLQDR